tara:strand:- start:96 stop:683 length:588 start_codon:yes stop_codon:yes gene_type:complete
MRIFLIILIFILSLQAWTKADDISDFEIEGMSIGDSLLDYLSKDEILQSETKYYPGSKKFKQVALYDRIKMETYDVVSVALKDNDKNYIIHEIKGFKRFPNHELCLNNRDEVVKDLKNLFNTNSYKINSYESTTAQDENSVFKSVDFEFSMGLIRLYCINWSKKIREDKGGFYDDSLTILIYDNEFKNFLKKAYN